LDRFAKAFRDKDIDGVMSAFARDIVSFDIVPPLQTVRAKTFATHWQKLFESHFGLRARDADGAAFPGDPRSRRLGR
jgi:ketosteroid isomerase-like protein